MKTVIISSLFCLSALAAPLEDHRFDIREPEPQTGANVGANMAANVANMMGGFRIAAVTSRTTTTASTTTAASTTCNSAAAATGNSDGSSNYITPILAQHNNHRANHSVLPLIWDNGLASTAQKIAASCNYTHNTAVDGGGYGQNIGAGYTPAQVPAMLTNGMYNGEVNYYPGYSNTTEPDMSTFGKWGHFTQIVWNSTTKVGCYTQYCPCGLASVNNPYVRPYFTVCNYSPPGNYIGNFKKNVFAPRNDPTVVI